jgi:hypothetical protein
MTDRVLSTLELNRALLARQSLLERSRASIASVVEGMGEVQSQYAPSTYVGLWSRMEAFERPRLDRALEARRLVQGTMMRSTIHVASRRDYWPIVTAIREERRRWWLGATRASSDRVVRRVAERVRRLLGDGPMTRAELSRALGADASVWNGVGLWIDLVRVPPSGTWDRRRADVFATAERWIGPPPPGLTADDGLRLLARRYLGAFGPASRMDLASWAGVAAATLEPVLASMRLRRFRDERDRELLDLPRAPLPDASTPAPVRILPTWDAVLLAHARRTEILPERYRGRIFATTTPHSFSTFLVDGRVAGTWRFERGRMRAEPFERLPRAARLELDAELERAVELHR